MYEQRVMCSICAILLVNLVAGNMGELCPAGDEASLLQTSIKHTFSNTKSATAKTFWSQTSTQQAKAAVEQKTAVMAHSDKKARMEFATTS